MAPEMDDGDRAAGFDATREETGPDMLSRLRDDGAAWAAEFRKTAIRLGYSDMDEGWLIGWFANAIENTEAVRRERWAADPVAVVDVWQPIETAPKDGSCILLARGVGHPDHPTFWWWMGIGHWSAKWSNWNDGIEPSGFADPNWWQPLPAAPAALRSKMQGKA